MSSILFQPLRKFLDHILSTSSCMWQEISMLKNLLPHLQPYIHMGRRSLPLVQSPFIQKSLSNFKLATWFEIIWRAPNASPLRATTIVLKGQYQDTQLRHVKNSRIWFGGASHQPKPPLPLTLFVWHDISTPKTLISISIKTFWGWNMSFFCNLRSLPSSHWIGWVNWVGLAINP